MNNRSEVTVVLVSEKGKELFSGPTSADGVSGHTDRRSSPDLLGTRESIVERATEEKKQS
jgi:hypothetical protein